MDTGRIALALSGAAAIALVGAFAANLIGPSAAPATAALPAISADQLISSIGQASPTALAGTVQLDFRLGLPGTAGAEDNPRTARVWADGWGRQRISLPYPDGERTVVDDGATVWVWNSITRSVTTAPAPTSSLTLSTVTALPAMTGMPSGPRQHGASRGGQLMTDPVQAASAVLSMLRPDSIVRLDPDATVAHRAAYQLVLDPVPTERTMLREVRIAVDGQTRQPLEVSVLANGSAEPALRIGFTQVSFGGQDPALFEFTPPRGVQVGPRAAPPAQSGVADPAGAPPGLVNAARPSGLDAAPSWAGQVDSSVIGVGWDTVLVRQMHPTRRPDCAAAAPSATGAANEGPPGPSPAVGTVLAGASRPISGPWGHGQLVSSSIGNVVITSDGRMATGAVPAQVLIEALTQ
jgi:outer membrane lipoprotein-sorting protein